MTKMMPVVVLGEKVGTAEDFYETDEGFGVGGFIPAKDSGLLAGDVSFNFTEGTVLLFDNEGTVVKTIDLVDTINKMRLQKKCAE